MKKVRFDEKLTVYVTTDWPQASRQARSAWMLKARNRRRFRKRNQSIAL